MWIADWTARAACKETDPDELFVQGAAQNRAKLICRGCVVRTDSEYARRLIWVATVIGSPFNCPPLGC